MKSASLAVVGLLLSSWACAQSTNIADAEALVRAMRADVVLLEASKAALFRATGEGQFTAAQYQCFEQLPASAFTADLAKVLSNELTPGEITDALAFYTSPTGVKFVDVTFVLLSRNANATGIAFAGKDRKADSRQKLAACGARVPPLP